MTAVARGTGLAQAREAAVLAGQGAVFTGAFSRVCPFQPRVGGAKRQNPATRGSPLATAVRTEIRPALRPSLECL